MSDLLHACRWCGYDERTGQHGIVGPAEKPNAVVMLCQIPIGSKPLAFSTPRDSWTRDVPDIGADVPGGGAI